MTLRCDCGKEIKDWRGARGHVQFTTGSGHGDKGEVPEGWKDLFTEVDESEDEDDQQDGGNDEDDEDDVDPSAEANTERDDSTASQGSRLKRVLFDDVRAIYGGDK
jgi:hypothetical protein